MQVCVMLEGQEGIGWDEWLSLASAAEAAGLEGLFRSDHYQSIVRPASGGALDAWATLAGLAARTTHLRLGTLVSPVTFRPVSVLAKSVVTVDHISAGRVELGVGAGWYEAEHVSYGFPFPGVRGRLDLLEAQLEEIGRQWDADSPIWPKPVQRPRPPVIIGGRAKPGTVRLAARFADEYNMMYSSLEDARRVRAILDDAGRLAGREPVRLSMMASCVVGEDRREVSDRLARRTEVLGEPRSPAFAGTVDELAVILRGYERLGVTRLMAQHLVHEDVEMVARLGELASALR
jgi:alkanesulfonate monooxygenase SsuD/methylene tetrahydromethanopterin reductase-like flavin-dependent oxidoreductase (luciferase family)